MARNEHPHDTVDLGEEVSSGVQAKRGAGIVVSVRLSPQEAEQLQMLARTAGKSLSDVAREALRGSIATVDGYVQA